MKTKFFERKLLSGFLGFAVLAVTAFIMARCLQPVGGSEEDTGGNVEIPVMIPAPPLRAATVPASDTGVPKQIYSVTDNKTNIYVFDLGFLRYTYVGTTAGPATYSVENSPPILQATKYEETTISETLSESVADCIEVSTTDKTTHETGGSTGTETEYTDWYEGWGIQILSCGFTLPKSFNDVITEYSSTSWSDSVTKVVTNSVSRTRSVETSFSKIETKGWTNGVSYPVDKNAPKGQR